MAMQYKYTVVVTKDDIERCATDEKARKWLADNLAGMVRDRFLFDVMSEAVNKRGWIEYGDRLACEKSITSVTSEVS